jgi:hypothetical protein
MQNSNLEFVDKNKICFLQNFWIFFLKVEKQKNIYFLQESIKFLLQQRKDLTFPGPCDVNLIPTVVS